MLIYLDLLKVWLVQSTNRISPSDIIFQQNLGGVFLLATFLFHVEQKHIVTHILSRYKIFYSIHLKPLKKFADEYSPHFNHVTFKKENWLNILFKLFNSHVFPYSLECTYHLENHPFRKA